MKLVMVHGRSQGGNNPAILKKKWLDALGYGLLRDDKTLPAATAIDFPFYGDELDQLVALANVPLAANAKGPQSDADEQLRGEMLKDIAAAMGITDADIAREFAGQPREHGPQNWEWVHAILRAMDRLPGVNSAAIDVFTRDVYVYLTNPGVRARIDDIVATAVAPEPCVVLAHSLGTVVAYNVLVKRAAAPAVKRFVTVGSPLGIRGIKRFLDTPVRCPACIGNWFNAFDDRDVVALVPLNQHNFDVTPAIDNKNDIRNFTDNRHGIEGYLADPSVAGKIVEFL